MSFLDVEQYPGRIFSIGDIHGCAAELGILLNHLVVKEGLTQDDYVIFVGDYIDRGPDSKGTIQLLIDFQLSWPKTVFLKGNHEDMMLTFLGFEGRMGAAWARNGGIETLASYGFAADVNPVEVFNRIPPEHVQFLQDLVRYIIFPDYVVVHAGLNPLRDLRDQVDDELFWIRDQFLSNIHYFEKLVLFGHTPHEEVFLNPPYKVGIDTGLVYGNMLSCVEVTEGRIIQVKRKAKRARTSEVTLDRGQLFSR